MQTFEYDNNKSASNFDKHGINFEVAQKLWDDPYFIQVKAKSDGEERYLVIGTIDAKYWSAVITYRMGLVRIISVRRSRKAEVSLYEG